MHVVVNFILSFRSIYILYLTILSNELIVMLIDSFPDSDSIIFPTLVFLLHPRLHANTDTHTHIYVYTLLPRPCTPSINTCHRIIISSHHDESPRYLIIYYFYCFYMCFLSPPTYRCPLSVCAHRQACLGRAAVQGEKERERQ